MKFIIWKLKAIVYFQQYGWSDEDLKPMQQAKNKSQLEESFYHLGAIKAQIKGYGTDAAIDYGEGMMKDVGEFIGVNISDVEDAPATRRSKRNFKPRVVILVDKDTLAERLAKAALDMESKIVDSYYYDGQLEIESRGEFHKLSSDLKTLILEDVDGNVVARFRPKVTLVKIEE